MSVGLLKHIYSLLSSSWFGGSLILTKCLLCARLVLECSATTTSALSLPSSPHSSVSPVHTTNVHDDYSQVELVEPLVLDYIFIRYVDTFYFLYCLYWLNDANMFEGGKYYISIYIYTNRYDLNKTCS